MDQCFVIEKLGAFGTITFAACGQDWQGLPLRAEIEVKTVRYPVTWSCVKYVNKDED